MSATTTTTTTVTTSVALHIYIDFDSTTVLQDTGNTLLVHEIGQKELKRLDLLPQTSAPGEVTLRKAEDMKWERIRLTVQEAADILVNPQDDVLALDTDMDMGNNGDDHHDHDHHHHHPNPIHQNHTRHHHIHHYYHQDTTTLGRPSGSQGQGQGQGQEQGTRRTVASMATTSAPEPAALVPEGSTLASRRPSAPRTDRTPFDERNSDGSGPARSYFVQLDPGFKDFHRYCRQQNIPITIVSIGIQPLIEEMLNRYLGYDHGIQVRANGLDTRDGHWRLLRRDTSPYGVEKGRAIRDARERDLQNPHSDQIMWCGDANTDFPAALRANIVLARQNTSLERLLRANSIPHQVFTTFATVREAVEAWVRDHTLAVEPSEQMSTGVEQGEGENAAAGQHDESSSSSTSSSSLDDVTRAARTGNGEAAQGKGEDESSDGGVVDDDDNHGELSSPSSSSSSSTPSTSDSRSVAEASDQ